MHMDSNSTKFLIYFLLFLLLSSCDSYTYEFARHEFNQRKYDSALEKYLKLAEKDHPKALYDLSLIYRDGLGGVKNKNKSKYRKYLRRSALLGHPIGLAEFAVLAKNGKALEQYKLGMLYGDGVYVKQDIPEAITWLYRSASAGHKKSLSKLINYAETYPNASNRLGIIYLLGQVVEQDKEKAIQYFKTAASEQYGLAQYNLCVVYGSDEWGELNQSLADSFFKNAVENGTHQAIDFYLINAQEGNSSALNLIEEYASKGIPRAIYAKGFMYFSGRGLEQNYQLALQWLTKSAELGEIDAYLVIAKMYSAGLGVEIDGTKTIEYYEAAAKQGNLTAMNNLGLVYHSGKFLLDQHEVLEKRMGVYEILEKYRNSNATAQNYRMAEYWYQQASEKGSGAAQYNLGRIYSRQDTLNENMSYFYGSSRRKDYININYDEALDLYKKALQNGITEASCALGDLYMPAKPQKKRFMSLNDFNTPINEKWEHADKNSAISYYQQGASKGHGNCINALLSLWISEKNYINAYVWQSVANLQGIKLKHAIPLESIQAKIGDSNRGEIDAKVQNINQQIIDFKKGLNGNGRFLKY